MAKTNSKKNIEQNTQQSMKGKQPTSSESITTKLLPSQVIEETKAQEDKIDVNSLPDFLTEEELDEFLVKSGALDKMLAQIKDSKPNKNWQDELDEL